MAHERGDLLAGRYRLEDRIASGGMGEVWHATDTVLARPVAVKTLHTDRTLDPQFRHRFRDEARALATLHHPGIVDVYDYCRHGNDSYLVMAHVHGQPLDRHIAAHGRLTTTETLSIVSQTAHALQTAHDHGIIHRDVKPANLILQPDGTVVLVDFGIARSPESTAVTGAREVLGTAYYIAPEQISKDITGPPADIYSLGAVAFHCLTGYPPFLGDNPVTIALQHVNDAPPPLPDDIPPAVRTLVLTAMAKDPADRYPTAAAMAAAAAAAAAASGGEVTTADLTPVRSGHAAAGATPPARQTRHRYVYVLLAALMVLLSAGTAVALADSLRWDPVVPAPTASTSTNTKPPTPSTAPATGHRTHPAENGHDGSPHLTATPVAPTVTPSHARPSSIASTRPSATTTKPPSRTPPVTPSTTPPKPPSATTTTPPSPTPPVTPSTTPPKSSTSASRPRRSRRGRRTRPAPW